MHGYEVLPAQQLPLTEDALVPELKSQLERCALSIHLVGRKIGPIPDGPASARWPSSRTSLPPRAAGGARCGASSGCPTASRANAPSSRCSSTHCNRTRRCNTAPISSRRPGSTQGHHSPHVAEARAPGAGSGSDRPGRAANRAPGDERRGSDRVDPTHQTAACAWTAGYAPGLRRRRGRCARGQHAAGVRLHAVILFYGAGDEVWKFHQESDLIKQAAASGGTRHRDGFASRRLPPPTRRCRCAWGFEPARCRAGFSEAALQPLLSSLPTTRPAQ